MKLKPRTAGLITHLSAVLASEPKSRSHDAAALGQLFPEYFASEAGGALLSLLENLAPDVRWELSALDRLGKEALAMDVDGQANRMYFNFLEDAQKQDEPAEEVSRRLAESPLHLHVPKAMELLGLGE